MCKWRKDLGPLTSTLRPCWTLKLGQHVFPSLLAGLQALGAAQAAIHRFEKAGTKWQRPPDYYAEMVKSDQHMARVKEQLMHEQQHMEQADERWGGASRWALSARPVLLHAVHAQKAAHGAGRSREVGCCSSVLALHAEPSGCF